MKNSLSKQLIAMISGIFIVVILTIGGLLPRMLMPIYEEALYTYLRQSHTLITEASHEDLEDVAHIFILKDNNAMISDNYDDIVPVPYTELIELTVDDQGKIDLFGETYYYTKSLISNSYRITITTSKFITAMKARLQLTLMPIILITLALVVGGLFIWSTVLVDKIKTLKKKVDNIRNKKYDHTMSISSNDEIHELEEALEEMRLDLETTEKYKQDMFQNISHDLKTPIAVIKSYIEAINDNVEPTKKGLKIIEEQTEKLEEKVKSLLYLNKLEHYVVNEVESYKPINIVPIIKHSKEQFKTINSKIKWELDLDKSKMVGTKEMWEIVIDNLLENATRYAKKIIKITLKEEKLSIYNDGDKIDPKIVKDIFSPYKKGVKGNFGLGLSIVQKTVNLFGYNIEIKNGEKGPTFIIKK